jgi:hypothetical protein
MLALGIGIFIFSLIGYIFLSLTSLILNSIVKILDYFEKKIN